MNVSVPPVIEAPCVRCAHPPARHKHTQVFPMTIDLVCDIPGCGCSWPVRDAPWRKP